jgi:hypothetical protein
MIFSQQSFRVDISCGWIDDSQHRLKYIKGGSENGAGQKQGFLNKIDWGTHPSHHLRRNFARRHIFKFHLIECLDMMCTRLFDSRSLKNKETYRFLKTLNWGVHECMVSNIQTQKETYSFEFGSELNRWTKRTVPRSGSGATTRSLEQTDFCLKILPKTRVVSTH